MRENAIICTQKNTKGNIKFERKGEIRNITVISKNGDIIIGNRMAETGDDTNVWPWIVAILVAGAGIVVAAKKKKKDD